MAFTFQLDPEMERTLAEQARLHGVSIARYIQEILAPCEDMRLVPAGGVDLRNLDDYLDAGVAAVAVGKEIASPRLAAERNFREIAQQAARFTEKIRASASPRPAIGRDKKSASPGR